MCVEKFAAISESFVAAIEEHPAITGLTGSPNLMTDIFDSGTWFSIWWMFGWRWALATFGETRFVRRVNFGGWRCSDVFKLVFLSRLMPLDDLTEELSLEFRIFSRGELSTKLARMFSGCTFLLPKLSCVSSNVGNVDRFCCWPVELCRMDCGQFCWDWSQLLLDPALSKLPMDEEGNTGICWVARLPCNKGFSCLWLVVDLSTFGETSFQNDELLQLAELFALTSSYPPDAMAVCHGNLNREIQSEWSLPWKDLLPWAWLLAARLEGEADLDSEKNQSH